MLRGSSWMSVLAYGIALSSAPHAVAADPSITWDAPAECPGEAEVRMQVGDALGDAHDGDAVGHIHARVRAIDEHHWELAVTFAAAPGAERRLVVDSCAAAVRATVFIVAITIDPLAEIPQAPEEAHIPAPEVPAQAQRSATPAPESSPTRVPAAPPVGERPPPAMAKKSPMSRRAQGLVQAGGAVQVGAFPTVTGGVLAGTGVAWPRARLVLGYARWFESRAVLDSRPQAGGVISVHAFTASAGPVWRWRSLEFPLRGGLEVGTLRAAGFGTDADRERRRPWLAFTVGSGLHWVPRALRGHGALVVQADAVVPALRPTLVIADTLSVFQIGPIGFRGALLLEARFQLRRPARTSR